MEPKLYTRFAEWWPCLSPPEEYEAEAALYGEHLAGTSATRTVLELGSGGGNTASYLKRRFQMTLVDRAAAMLDVSGSLNPECEHVLGDMRTIRLGRRFDAVFLHDALSYLTNEADLRLALITAAVHLEAGRRALLVPDFFKETYRPGTTEGGADRGGRSLRFLEWCHEPIDGGCSVEVDYAILLKDHSAPVEVVHDRHVLGIFARETWLAACRDAGFVPEIVRIINPSTQEEQELIVCRFDGCARPGGSGE